MGLGVGIKCRICGTQLYYDTDCEEIVANENICHKCKTLVNLIQDRNDRVGG